MILKIFSPKTLAKNFAGFFSNLCDIALPKIWSYIGFGEKRQFFY
jgi:hypothetical protein